MSVKPQHLHQYIIYPVCEALNRSNAQDAAYGLMLTCAVESGGGRALRQYGFENKTPYLGAWGIFQMEYETLRDHIAWTRAMRSESTFALMVYNACEHIMSADPSALAIDPLYATVMARVHYWVRTGPLPKAGDFNGWSELWKEVYNTPAGSGHPEKARRVFLDWVGISFYTSGKF